MVDGHWWCSCCKMKVGGLFVNYRGTHDICGWPMHWVDCEDSYAELRSAVLELLTVAELRGDNFLPHPADDAKLHTTRMQNAWDELALLVKEK